MDSQQSRATTFARYARSEPSNREIPSLGAGFEGFEAFTDDLPSDGPWDRYVRNVVKEMSTETENFLSFLVGTDTDLLRVLDAPMIQPTNSQHLMVLYFHLMFHPLILCCVSLDFTGPSVATKSIHERSGWIK